MQERLNTKCTEHHGKDKEKEGAPRKFNPEMHLQLWLHWMKYYPSEKYFACQLDCVQNTVQT